MLISVDLFKALACILIINFHCLYIYPDFLQKFSFGGDLGNNMFFLVSGFTLIASINRTRINNIGEWIKKRYIRIIPICFLFNLISYMLYTNRDFVGNVFHAFVFPTIHWFTGALTVFYPMLFLVEKIKKKWVLLIGVVILLGTHVIFDSIYSERYIIGFISMIAGCEIKEVIGVIKKKNKTWVYFLCGFIFFVIYALLKLVYAKEPAEYPVLHLLIGLLTIAFASVLLTGLYYSEEKLKILKEKHSLAYRIVKLFANLTLSIYLTQQFINYVLLDWFLRLPFPISLILYLSFVLLASLFVYRIDNWISNKLKEVVL